MPEKDISQELAQRIREAAAAAEKLNVRGGGTKDFFGRAADGTPLDVAGHEGIVSHEPTELVLTARGGARIDEIEEVLSQKGQMLPFDPPRFGPGSTLGGAVASGLAGPRRPWGGAPRDLVLGVRIVDGRGRILRFGGQVMKNVAGYDLSRLMAGAMGTLGVLLEISVKVLPRPPLERTLTLELGPDTAIAKMRDVAKRPFPLTGAAYHSGCLYLRLAGSESVLAKHRAKIGGEFWPEGERFWKRLRDHELPFFQQSGPLWRLSVPPRVPADVLAAPTIIDWGGAQRWIRWDGSAEELRAVAAENGGHATLFRHGKRESEVFHPLAPAVERLHRRLKNVFDPEGILNHGRLYPGW